MRISRRTLERSELFLVSLFLIFCSSLLFNSMRKQLGFSDETLYLILAHNADTSISYGGLWSFYTHYLYVVAGQDIFIFRVLGGLILLGVALIFGYSSIFSQQNAPAFSKSERVIGALAIGLSSLFLYQRFIFTPGYDWLAFTGVLIALCGYANYQNSKRKIAVLSATCFGFGIFVSTMGRPVAGLILVIFLITDSKLSRHKTNFAFLAKYALATMSALVVIHLLFIADFKDSLASINLTKLIASSDPSHSFSTILKSSVVQYLQIPWMALSITFGSLGLLVVIGFLTRLQSQRINIQIVKRVVITTVIVEFLVISLYYLTSKHGQVLNFAWVTIFLTSLALLWIDRNLPDQKVENLTRENSGTLGWISMLGGLVALTFTSNIRFNELSQIFLLFYVAGCFLISAKIRKLVARNFLNQLVLVFLLISFSHLMIIRSIQHYDSASLASQNQLTTVGPTNSKLLLDEQRALDVAKVREFRDSLSLRRAPILLNLTPVALYMNYELGFRNVETPLLLNQRIANQIIENNVEELRDAWLLTTSSAYRTVPLDPVQIANKINRNFPSDYRLMKAFTGKYCLNVYCTVKLWAPKTQ